MSTTRNTMNITAIAGWMKMIIGGSVRADMKAVRFIVTVMSIS